MSTRTLVSDDGAYRTYEVRDDDGNVIGSDVETINPEPVADPDVTELAAALANLPTDTLAALKAALGIA